MTTPAECSRGAGQAEAWQALEKRVRRAAGRVGRCPGLVVWGIGGMGDGTNRAGLGWAGSIGAEVGGFQRSWKQSVTQTLSYRGLQKQLNDWGAALWAGLAGVEAEQGVAAGTTGFVGVCAFSPVAAM